MVFLRPRELCNAEWTEFDLNQAEWRIPAGKMKMKALHIIPLPSQAVAILRELHTLTGNGKYLFPNTRTSAKPMASNTILAALRSLGYMPDEMTAHGFRHMASTLEYYFFRIAGFVGWVRRVYAVTQHDQADDIQDCWVTR